MEITEVRIKLMDKPEDRLRGFCSVTFDACFVIRDLKIIEGNKGPFVAMPSRKLTSNCHKCRCKNNLKSNYCNQCGTKLKSFQIEQDSNGRAKLYADIAHPINAECRNAIQAKIIEALEKEEQLSHIPGYHSRYDESYDDRQKGERKRTDHSSRENVDQTLASDSNANLPGQQETANKETTPRAPDLSSVAEKTDSVDSPQQPEQTRQTDPNTLSDPLGDSLADPLANSQPGSQAEVETRIDFQPSNRDLQAIPKPHQNPHHSDESDSASASTGDKDNAFGKGIL